MKKVFLIAALFAAAAVLAFQLVGCDETTRSANPSSRSYQGHESDLDIQAFIKAYPDAYGTRLDDCQTCHRAGVVTTYKGDQTYNPCSFCHLIPYPDSEVTGAPTGYEDTLNEYGLAYKNAGRDKAAILAIADLDSDGDNYSNVVEINDERYPGDNSSYPGLPTAPIITLNLTQVKAIASHTQFLLMNSHKQEFDTYAKYRGVKIFDLLNAAGVDLDCVDSITVIAPDGYMKDFDNDEYMTQYPDGLWYPNLDPASFADPDQGFVEYPSTEHIPTGVSTGGMLPDDMWVIIAYWRDGQDLNPSYLDPTSGKLEGEGPYRIIIPQATPGAPDRGSKYSPSGYDDGYDYDDDADHNAGLAVRGVVAIRCNPMPPGYEEYDWKNGGFSLVDDGKLIIYGAGVSE